VTPTNAYPILSNFNTVNPSVNNQVNVFSTPPQTIPSRFPEPATPQNTPADIAFSGFNSYRQQALYELSRNSIAHAGQLNAIKEATVNPIHTFSTISAAKVTEKLENFIAEQNDETLSVKCELSADIAKISENITASEKTEYTEEFTEINLNVNANQDSLEQSNELKFNVLSEKLATPQTLDAFTVPSTTNYFVNPSTNNHTAPTFYNSLFHTSEHLKDSFSFTQSMPTTDLNNFSNHTIKTSDNFIESTQTFNSNTSSEIDPPKKSESTGNIDLSSKSIWQSNQTEVIKVI
jgi:hypothetical protein